MTSHRVHLIIKLKNSQHRFLALILCLRHGSVARHCQHGSANANVLTRKTNLQYKRIYEQCVNKMFDNIKPTHANDKTEA